MNQRSRDRLLSAAMKLSDDPTKTLAFLEVADAVIDDLRNPSPDQQRRDILQRLYALRRAYEGSGFQSRVTVAIESLEEIR